MTMSGQTASRMEVSASAYEPENNQEPVVVDAGNFNEIASNLPARARAALSVLMKMPKGSLTITVPDGRQLKIGGNGPGPEARVTLKNWNLASRAFMSGTIGVAESYVEGDWESPDVTTFLELFVVNNDATETVAGGASWLLGLFQKFRHWLNENTPSRAKRNIAAHYDLGNQFYSQWLDPSMTYSSALYSSGANDLESAQAAKYRALARDAGIGPNDHVLEIGCGWGGFAEFAAREIGCHVTGLTISKEQHEYATERIAKAGLSDKVDIKFQDYRDETGRYDRIASIEMFEAVGEKYWTAYFDMLRRCLKPGGRAGLQVITISDHAFENYRSNPDFIQRYVFPGGMLPTCDHLRDVAGQSGLKMVGQRAFGPDYARTLAEWRERFRGAWEEIRPLGFDDRFKRLWEFYLHYCEAGFRGRNIDVRQVVYE